jgi:NAD(P)H-hydrate epimerase
MVMLDYKEIAVLDRNSAHLGVPTFILMENAGSGVVDVVLDRMELSGKSITLFCGLGNNGGDGFVAARQFAKNLECKVRVVLLGKPNDIKSTLANENFHRLPKNVEILSGEKTGKDLIKQLDLSNDSVIIDAMLGVGITGNLKEPVKSIVNLINTLPQRKSTAVGKKGKGKGKALKKSKSTAVEIPERLVVAVDVPTGLQTKTAMKPDITITFHDSKYGMTPQNSGEIIIHDIGIPPEAECYVGPGDLTYIPTLKQDAHKGDHGRVLIIGGGPYTGAPTLVGLSALRTGIDLVHIAVPNKISDIIAGSSPNLIVHPLPNSSKHLIKDDLKSILKLIGSTSADALIIGPGLGSAPESLDTVVQLINKVPKNIPMLLDADALGAIAKLGKDEIVNLMKPHHGVLTPHKGEFNRLLSSFLAPTKRTRTKKNPKKDSKELSEFELLQSDAKVFSNRLGSNWTVLLKGRIDIITNGETVKLNHTGNAGMTVGGTGDVLAGITGALLSMGMEPYLAARAAAFINGYSGDLAYEKFRNGLMATDIIDLIPQCLKYSID